MKLHYAKGTVACAVAIALQEAGIEHTLVRVDFAAGEQTKAPFHALNPKGRVPLIETDKGVLTETGAILEYIGTLAPGMIPEDPFAAAQMREVMYYLASTVHVNHAHRYRGSRWADRPESFEDMQAKVPETMAASAAYLESHALAGDFVAGKDVSIADGYLYIISLWIEADGVALADYPKLAAFRDRMETRPSVAAVRDAGVL